MFTHRHSTLTGRRCNNFGGVCVLWVFFLLKLQTDTGILTLYYSDNVDLNRFKLVVCSSIVQSILINGSGIVGSRPHAICLQKCQKLAWEKIFMEIKPVPVVKHGKYDSLFSTLMVVWEHIRRDLHTVLSLRCENWRHCIKQEIKVIWQKAPHGGPIPRLGVTPGGRNLYHWIPGVGVPISVP